MKNERVIFADSFLTVMDSSQSIEEQKLNFFQTSEQRSNFRIPDEVLTVFNSNPGFVVTYVQYLRGIDIIPEEHRKTCWEKIIAEIRSHPQLPSYFNQMKVKWEYRKANSLAIGDRYSVTAFLAMAAA